MTLTQITEKGIKDGEIINADINASAAIARTKLANVDLVDDTTPQLGGHLDSNGFDIKLKDNDQLFAGDSQDINIYHDGSDSYFYSGASTLFFRNANNEKFASFISDGAVELYYDNSKKLDTINGGVSVTGQIQSTVNFRGGDGVELSLGDAEDIKIYHDGSHSYIADTGTGNLNITASTVNINNAANSENIARFIENGAVELYYDNSKKFETTSTGGLFSGKLHFQDGSSLSGANKVVFGDSEDLQIYHDGSKSIINDNGTGQLYLQVGGSPKFNTQSGGVQFYGSVYGDDNNKIELGNDQDLKIYHDGNHSRIVDSGTGFLVLETSRLQVNNSAGNEEMIVAVEDGTVQLFYDNSKKLETISTGVNITGGIRLGGNNADNELDDYEIGTWTPVLGSDNADPTQSYNTQNGTYVKIGNFVHLQFDIRMAASGISGGSGNCMVDGLPFPMDNSLQTYGMQASFGFTRYWGGENPTGGYINAGSSSVYLMDRSTGDGDNYVNAVQVTNDTRLLGSFAYKTHV